MKGWKPALLALLVLLASGGAFWLAPGPADDTEATQHGENPWALPTLPPREAPEQAHQRLQQLQPWGKSGATAMAGSTATGWRLRGVVRLEGQRYALVEVGGKVRRYGVGEALPLGEKLLSVQADRIEIEIPTAERRLVVLYPQVETSAAVQGRK